MNDASIKKTQSDEIDLFDLIDDIKQFWHWVLGFIILGVVAASAYIFIASPLYRTTAVIKDASAGDLVDFNQPALATKLIMSAVEKSKESLESEDTIMSDESVFSLSTEDAFLGARSALRSASVRKAFYKNLIDENNADISSWFVDDELTEEQNLANFLKRFSYADPNAKEALDTYLEITFELGDAQLATDLLNRYVDFALVSYERRVKQEYTRTVQSQVQLYSEWAEGLRASYNAKKQSRIVYLMEAAAVAKSIDQIRPFYNTNNIFVSSEPPLYMMGTLALEQEVKQLQGRAKLHSEDIFVEGLPLILRYKNALEAVTIDWGQVRYALVDQPALLPEKPAKPRKAIILALGGICGLMVGIMAALLTAASRRHSARFTSSAETVQS
ncbi:MAG: Wzz/FepE/Etk N-terminal domain-containing protein [Oleibacter sp.]|nr:Wzz/FepE/Etk N-terminal domain-containing protein [Thalassolituus sp.]